MIALPRLATLFAPRFFNHPPDDFVSPVSNDPSFLPMTIVNYAWNGAPRPDNLHVPSIVISTNFLLFLSPSGETQIAFLRGDSLRRFEQCYERCNIANLSKKRRACFQCPISRVAIITLYIRSCVREIIQVSSFHRLLAVKFLFDDSYNKSVGRERISLFFQLFLIEILEF